MIRRGLGAIIESGNVTASGYLYWKFQINSYNTPNYVRWGIFEAFASSDCSGPNLWVPGTFSIYSSPFSAGENTKLLNRLHVNPGSDDVNLTNATGDLVFLFDVPTSIRSLRICNYDSVDVVYINSMTILASNDGSTWDEIKAAFNPGIASDTLVKVEDIGGVDLLTGVGYSTSSARYWLLRWTSQQLTYRLGYYYAKEIQAFESTDGTGTNIGLSPTVITAYNGATVVTSTLLNDDDTSTNAANAASETLFKCFLVDLGAGNEKRIRSFKFHYESTGLFPSVFDILTSDDLTTWSLRGASLSRSDQLLSGF